MKILFLGPADSPLIPWLYQQGEEVKQTMEPIKDGDSCLWLWSGHKECLLPDFIISYGYRHLVPKAVLDEFPNRAINLHIGYLPWNRGADPNLWSWIDDTPKGVTIHYMDEGIDTGVIIDRWSFDVEWWDANDPAGTLSSSYKRLHLAIQEMFRDVWHAIKLGRVVDPRPQMEFGLGSFHRSTDATAIKAALPQGWDTPVRWVVENAENLSKLKGYIPSKEMDDPCFGQHGPKIGLNWVDGRLNPLDSVDRLELAEAIRDGDLGLGHVQTEPMYTLDEIVAHVLPACMDWPEGERRQREISIRMMFEEKPK